MGIAEPWASADPDRTRRHDRDKKRKGRAERADLVRKLGAILRQQGRARGARTLHDTLAAAVAATRAAVAAPALRAGMLSLRSEGLLLVDAASLCILDANAFVLARLGVPPSAVRDCPLAALLPLDDAADAALVLRHLARGRFRDASLCRFVLGLRLAAAAGPAACDAVGLPTEFVPCGGGARHGERDLFMLFVRPVAAPADSHGGALRALRAAAGFRAGEAAVRFRPGGPAAAWRSWPRRQHPVCPRRHVLPDPSGGCERGGGGADPEAEAEVAARLELRAEGGDMAFRLLLGARCLLELRLRPDGAGGGTLRQTLPPPGREMPAAGGPARAGRVGGVPLEGLLCGCGCGSGGGGQAACGTLRCHDSDGPGPGPVAVSLSSAARECWSSESGGRPSPSLRT